MTSNHDNATRVVYWENATRDTLRERFLDNYHGRYHTHLFCHHGTIEFLFNNKEMQCSEGQFSFWYSDSRLANLKCSNKFKASMLLIEKDYLLDNSPDQGWSIDSLLYSKEHPVKNISNEDKERILSNFRLLYNRFQEKDHRFYDELVKLQLQIFILQMWHTFANAYDNHKRSLQAGSLYDRFIQLVEEHCIKEREVKFYARKLNITAKHLNYICKINTDIPAKEWIKRYTKERILLLLQNEKFNIAEIADEMEFSSRSFFTRYVKKLLGVTPKEYRQRLSR